MKATENMPKVLEIEDILPKGNVEKRLCKGNVPPWELEIGKTS